MDSGADSTGIGGNAWIIDSKSDRKVTISGYNKEDEAVVYIGSAYTAVDLPDGQTILLQVNEATIHGATGKTLLSVIQMRDNNVFVDEIPRKFGGLSCLKKDDIVIPFTLHNGMMTLKIRKPTKYEENNCERIDVTAPDI